jgi:kinesin family protein 4/21/27
MTGLKQVAINSIEDLLNALNFGSSIRQTDATAVNARSSRSHAVFSLNLVQKKGQQLTNAKDKRRSMPLEAFSGSENWITVDSKLHFVDLAGSERLKNTGAYGERAKEGISINAGLASLGKVIAQLSSRSPGTHISYRDSRLTRLLQDSLGGNAITYMVACINPAEFHLSETLNTVQYAQRARAIQIKPQIQQVHDDSDKQAVIDRLRAEISFLRDQIRLSDRSDRRSNAPQERSERHQEREIELQNQLLDIQENYSALSQRHARLISEIAKARDTDSADTPVLKDAIGSSALERLKRSNSFAEAVEQVVLEYEKTIQTLEGSLSNTRSTLSSSESTLLEKETKIAYLETLNHQLQSRLQKAMDRESNDENYLRELEARVAGANTDEEKHSAMVSSLRKELTRVRESEAGAEDYISTLEERLAEAEQQHEMMTREIERLEHVIERQRSINKLDNLLYELDNIRHDSRPKMNGHSATVEEEPYENFIESETEPDVDGRTASRASKYSEEHVDEHGEHLEEHPDEDLEEHLGGAVQQPEEEHERMPAPSHININQTLRIDERDEPTSPAQTKFVNDKLEAVTQELFDLRVEHESTVTDFDELQRKYHVALTSMAELQDALEDARRGDYSRPVSFLTEKAAESSHQRSRTLSSELSSAGESAAAEAVDVHDTAEAKDGEARDIPAEDKDIRVESKDAQVESKDTQAEAKDIPIEVPAPAQPSEKEASLEHEVEELRKRTAESEGAVSALQDSYSQLQEKHQDTLEYVEALKAEVHKATMTGRVSPNPGMIRRKAERSSVLSDRANRSFAAIRNLVLDNFEEDPDRVQAFESNISAAMTEFHLRSERVMQLEGELNALKKDMESKTAIINGLARERTSLKAASPIDMSALTVLERQLKDGEKQIKILSERHVARERELLGQVEALKANLEMAQQNSPNAATFSENGSARSVNGDDHQLHLAQLQKEAADWQSKHDSAVETMKASEKHLLATINDLESNLRSAEMQLSRSASPDEVQEFAMERRQHQETVTSLQKELEQHKSLAGQNTQRMNELEQSYNKMLTQMEQHVRVREQASQEIEKHKGMVATLESQIEAYQVSVASHQVALETLKSSHTKEIDDLKAQALKSQAESTEKLEKALAQHKEATAALQAELEKARSNESTAQLEAELAKAKEQMAGMITEASMILNKPTNMSNITSHIHALVNARKDIGAMHETAASELRHARDEAELLRAAAEEADARLDELKTINEETLRELQRVSDKERKSSRLVEELEEQLNSNFDQTQAANNRLSAMQTERQEALATALAARAELDRDLQDMRARCVALEREVDELRRGAGGELQRSNSANAQIRKSVSPVNLPSPPPAIPLPPLPGNGAPATPGAQQTGTPSIAGSVASSTTRYSPPGSRHASKDMATSIALSSQRAEDQEARIRTIEKNLFAEKQLTATLEEALTDLETSSGKLKQDMEAWRRKCSGLEEELSGLRREKQQGRLSVQQMEEDAKRRIDLEKAKLEERMQQLNSMTKKQKKKSSINCF